MSVIGADETPSSRRISVSVCAYSPSPKCAYRTWPLLSIRYFAGQYWFAYAFHVAKSLSWTTGYFTPSRSIAAPTFDALCSKANSGVCTPTITSPFERYRASHASICGSVRRQLMQEYVQKSTSTTLPRSALSFSGGELNHCPPATKSG